MRDLARVPGRIAVVGPCGSGKSELVCRLQALGYEARHCGQEHSYVPDMWQRISRPQILVYLDASPSVIARRQGSPLNTSYHEEQNRRLSHARSHCQIYVDTDALDLEQVAAEVVAALDHLGLAPGDRSAAGYPGD
ncbi:MAG: hypothetical protein R6X16_14695 [Anaerolineae bacterium]